MAKTSAAPAAQSEAPYAPFAGPAGGSFNADLRKQTAAVRLTYQKFGVRRAVKGDLAASMAAAVSAQPAAVSAGKKLIDTTGEAWRSATGAIGRARLYWRTMTVPFPVKGIRLIRKDRIPAFSEAMEKFKDELDEGLEALDRSFTALILDAQHSLGQLFNRGDYPEQVSHDFCLEWDFPSVEPPDYLKELHPDLWQQQKDRIERQFAEAAALADEAFAADLQKLVSHLLERLTPGADGKKKSLSKSALGNMSEFFQRFQEMKISSNRELEQLVNDAQRVIGAVQVDEVRGNDQVRQTLQASLGEVAQRLDGMIVTQPRRAIRLEDDEETEDGG